MSLYCGQLKSLKNCYVNTILLTCFCLVAYLLPKPSWICGPAGTQEVVSAFLVDKHLKVDQWEASKNEFIDPAKNVESRMFPIYNHDDTRWRSENTSGFIAPRVNVFKIRNFNFTHFGRNWVNTQENGHNVDTRKGARLRQPQREPGRLRSKTLRELRKIQKLPDCVRLKVPLEATPTKICVHYPADDKFISNRIRDTGGWEKELVFQMGSFLMKNPKSQLVDLGCNIGVFSLVAASLDRPSLAVDILPSNLALIQLSLATNDELMENDRVSAGGDTNGESVDAILQHAMGYPKNKNRTKYTQLVTTLHNAVYSRRQKMSVYLKDWDSNLGGTEVKELGAARSDSPVIADGSQILVDAVCLDDLVPYIKANLSVFLKLDIEGSEPDALLCATQFFMYADVRVILMEILFHRYSLQGKAMVQFLLRHDMLPSKDVEGKEMLNTKAMYEWPENMFWLKMR
ncbi:unnamed protein product [Lymnaea stagnalis]|uniref:Methyltransferase FkbM domain-containing protein n=1 Tax=Lymnaea stagnalis TaxID=6523 RepID=A0AAV2IGK2_LYMST